MHSFKKTGSIKDFQEFIHQVYSTPDDRLYSIWDLLVQQQRFTMRALKGIRKGNAEKLKYNLLVSLAWLMAIVNRLHIDIEEEVWKRFPMLCSYCGKKPCVCKSVKLPKRAKVKVNDDLRPETLTEYQQMFREIYPPQSRTLPDAGVHLAEEMGETSEAVHNYLGQHLEKQFNDIKLEAADYISCIFGVANSADLDIAQELSKLFNKNCHVCHKAPCVCSFSIVVELKT